MTTYLLHDSAGEPVSVGTVVADPLPDGLAAVALTDTEAAALSAGASAWDATTRTVAPVPAPADPRADLIAQVEQATTVAKLRAAVLAALDAGAI